MLQIKSNFISLSIIQLVSYVLPPFVLIYLTSTVGIERYGILAFCQSLVSACSIFIEFGYTLSATEKISKYRDKKIFVGKIISGIFMVKIILYVLCALAIIIYTLLSVKYIGHRSIFFLSLISLIAQGFFPFWLFQGIEKMKYITLIFALDKIIYVVMVILFIKEPSDYFLVPLFSGISGLISFAFSIWMIYKLGYSLSIPTAKTTRYCFKFSKPFFASRIGVGVYANSGLLVLGLVASPSITALYAIAEQAYRALQAIVVPLSQTLYPYMVQTRNIALMLRIIIMISVIAPFVGLFGYWCAPILFSRFFSSEWLNVIPIVNLFFVAIVIHYIAVILGYPLSAAVNRIDVANNSIISGSVVYLFLLSFLLYFHWVTPNNLVKIMILGELFVLGVRAKALLPLAIKSR